MHVSVEATCSSDTGKCWSGFPRESWPEFLTTLATDSERDPFQRSPCCSGKTRLKRRVSMLRSKMATLLTIVSAMLISAGMTWQQRLLFIGGMAFGVVVEALPSLVDELKERVAEWRRFRQFRVKGKAA